MLLEAVQCIPYEIGSGFVAGIEQKNAIVQQLFMGQHIPLFPRNQTSQHIFFRIARLLPAASDE